MVLPNHVMLNVVQTAFTVRASTFMETCYFVSVTYFIVLFITHELCLKVKYTLLICFITFNFKKITCKFTLN